MKQFLTLALTCFPLLCFGAPTYTTYFNNTHTYTNATIAGTNFAGRGVFTNGITAGASTFTGEVTSTLGSISADASALDATATWNNAGVTFTGLKLNITDTASAAGSSLLELQLGGTMAFRARKDGAIVAQGASGTSGFYFQTSSDTSARTFLGADASGNAMVAFGPGNATRDTFLLRDAANTLALRNGTSAQAFNIYNTYTDASNYERGFARYSGGIFQVGTTSAGTGAATAMGVGTLGSAVFRIFTSGQNRWQVNSSGHLLAETDNTYDIGASGATRPRNYFGAGTISSGGTITSGASVVIASGSVLAWSTRTRQSSPSDGVLTLYNDATTDFNRLQFGGTSASFPALKRSSTEIQVRLADDSADGGLKSGTLSNTGIRVMTPSSLQTLAAANALLANATKVRVVGSGGAVTLTSTPTIADGSDGQYVMIQGTDDTNTLTVQDQGSLASSNLELGAATRVLGAGDVLVLTFDSTASVWYEVSFANN